MLSPDAARSRILAALAPLAPLPGERVPLVEALSRALAEDLVPEQPLPAFDAATMDGYALRASDAPRPGARLPVAYEVFAGRPAPRPLPAGACCRIFTGAPIPEGADAVEMQEEVRRAGRSAVFRRAAEAGRFVRSRGSDLAAGAAALPAGAVVDAGTVGLAAGIGRTELLVRSPAARGDPPDRRRAGAPRSPPRPRPAGRVERGRAGGGGAGGGWRAGAPPGLRRRRRVRWRAPSSRRAASTRSSPSGGVSVGDRDLVRGTLEAAGARLGFWRVAMRPGKPFAFGLWGRTAVFGLPGNPASALVTFELFVRPALRALAGLPGDGRHTFQARLATAQEKPTGLTVFLRCRLRGSAADPRLEPLPTQSSGSLSSTAGHDALAVLPAGRARLPRGARVAAILLRPPREA